VRGKDEVIKMNTEKYLVIKTYRQANNDVDLLTEGSDGRSKRSGTNIIQERN